MKRSAGVLLHITSLYDQYGCGTFGSNAYHFVDLLKEAGFTYWQILPFSIADSDNSPYSSLATFFGNPMMIDLVELKERALLKEEDLINACHKFDFENQLKFKEDKERLLRIAFSNLKEDDKKIINEYVDSNDLIKKASQFFALREANDYRDFQKWEIKEYKNIDYYNFINYTFYNQWFKLKKYANDLGIKIIGDVPIYVNLESADVYYNKDVFMLDSDSYPEFVSGVPDGNNGKGQKWNHPLYDVKKLKESNYHFLIERFKFFSDLFDLIRIDHFRAFSSFYAIPYDKTALEGKWMEGVGRPFLKLLIEKIGEGKLIAEDVGGLDKDTQALLKEFNIPGMNILEFNYHIDNYKDNSIAYTTTHDNNTLLGFINRFDEDRYAYFKKCVNIECSDRIECATLAIEEILKSKADIAIIPMQDLLLQGEDRRMNVPGTRGNNWYYQMNKDDVCNFEKKIKYFKNIIKLGDR